MTFNSSGSVFDAVLSYADLSYRNRLRGGGRDFKDIDVLLRFSSAHGIARIAQWMAGHPDVCLTVAFYGTSLRLQCSNRVAVRHAVVEDGHQWFMITIYYYWLAKDVDVKIVATPQYGKCFALCRSS